MSKKSESARNNNSNNKYEQTKNSFIKEAKLNIKKIEQQNKLNKEHISDIEKFIEFAKEQSQNNDLNEEIRLKYKDLIKEQESLRDNMIKDIYNHNELIKFIKESIKDFH